jgi:hypothetical protein
VKHKYGQVETVGVSYAKVDLHVWKWLKEEEEVRKRRAYTIAGTHKLKANAVWLVVHIIAIHISHLTDLGSRSRIYATRSRFS